MANLSYLFLRFLTLLMHLFPLRVHYIVSDILCFLVKDIIGYRKKVVFKNLHNSFPEKDQKEIKKIATRFYHHFCDQIIEMLYFANISSKEIENRISYSGIELIREALDNDRPVIAMLGHYGNWEWLSSFSLKIDKPFFMLYKPLHSEGMDKFMKDMRGRQGAIPLPKDNAFRTLIGLAIRKEASFSGFIADQTPKVDDIQHWVTFLNQPTPVFLGAEKIGKRTNSRIVFAHMSKPRRGHYHCEISMIDDQPAKSPEYFSTEKFFEILEEKIIEAPELWLWSHNRWKHKPKNTEIQS